MTSRPPLPEAILRPERRISTLWLVPVAALLLTAWLIYAALSQRGYVITVELPDGHGLHVGDDVRHLGIAVGEVRAISLAPDGERIIVTAGLTDRADVLARAGSRFWVVRPRLRLSGAEGLETLIGPRYLAVRPRPVETAGARQRHFVGLTEPPAVAATHPGDLEVILVSPRRGSVRAGAPVSYRQVRVGTVRSVGLAADASGVEARLHIEQPYRALIREGTRFWDAGGVRTTLNLSGLSVEMESLIDLVVGGVAFATPPLDRAGDDVITGHRFALAVKPQDEWLAWNPSVPIGSELLPPGAVLPNPLWATVGWRQGFLVKGARSREGWVLQTDGGLVGPADLLTNAPSDKAERQSVSLEVAGVRVPMDMASVPAGPGLVRLAGEVQVSDSVWPLARVRTATEAEDAIAVADPTATPLSLTATRLHDAAENGWWVDPSLPIDPRWHGACVLSRTDGALLGMLLVTDEGARVAPVTVE